MGVGSDPWQIFGKIQVQPNVAHAKVVVAQGKRVFEDLVQMHRSALRFMLPRKTQ